MYQARKCAAMCNVRLRQPVGNLFTCFCPTSSGSRPNQFTKAAVAYCVAPFVCRATVQVAIYIHEAGEICVVGRCELDTGCGGPLQEVVDVVCDE